MNQKDMMRVGKQLLRHAKAAGATDAIVSIDTSTERSVTVRDDVLDDVAFSSSAGFTVTAVVGDRRGYASSSSFESDDLARIAKEAVLSALQVSGNKHVRLARPDEWPCAMEELSERMAGLDCYDRSPPPTLKELETRARALDRLACAFPGIARSEGTSFGFQSDVSVQLLSNGFSVVSPSTQYSKSTSVIAEKVGEMKSSYHWHAANHCADLIGDEECARRAGEYAVKQLGARSMKTEAMPVIFDKRVSPRLLGAFFGAISGERVHQKETFLLDHLGSRIFRDDVQIIERPHMPRRLQSALYDDDCVKTTPWTLVDKGQLMMWATSIESASKLGVRTSTGHASGAHNLLLCPSMNSLDALIRKIDRGFLVTDLMGRGTNIATGAFSVGAEGFLIEHGEIVRAVNKVTIAGNLLEMFRNMIPANDCSDNPYGANAPSCLVGEMMVAGDR